MTGPGRYTTGNGDSQSQKQVDGKFCKMREYGELFLEQQRHVVINVCECRYFQPCRRNHDGDIDLKNSIICLDELMIHGKSLVGFVISLGRVTDTVNIS